jgi:sarcosine oxidase subunit alpha
MTSSSPPLARSPLHAWHTAHGARFETRDGWLVPLAYTSEEEEVQAAQAGLGLADVSAYAKTSFIGPGVASIANTFAVPTRRQGQVTVVNLDGPAVACRLTDDHLLLVGLSTRAARGDHLGRLADGLPVRQFDVSTTYACLCLVGSQLEVMLPRLTPLDPGAVPQAGGCAETGLGGVQAVLVRPPGGALPMLYVLVAWDLAEYVWERVQEVGRSLAILPIGWDAVEHFQPLAA